MTAESILRKFAEFLDVSWEIACELAKHAHPSFMADWQQANWEALVESALPDGQLLSIYGEGADVYPNSSRVFLPDAMPTHIAVIKPKNAVDGVLKDLLSGQWVDCSEDGVPIEEFVGFRDAMYRSEPPFDCVRTGDHLTKHVFRISDGTLDIRPIKKDEI